MAKALGNKTRKYEALYSKERDLLDNAKHELDSPKATKETLKGELKKIIDSYEDILDQAAFITKVSDRLQTKLDKSNVALEEKNILLQNYIDELTKARIGKKATAITLTIAIALFVFTEGFIEPRIDDYVLSHQTDFISTDMASLGLKAILALLIKPIEKIVEIVLTRRASKILEAEKKKS